MPFRFNPFTDRLDLTEAGGAGIDILTLTGNSGGAVTSDGTGNVNLLGTGTVDIVGNPGTHTLTISVTPTALVIDGDTGSITGNPLTIKAGLSTQNCGSTVSFVNSGSTSILNVTDASNNTIVGKTAGNATLTGTNNVGFGRLSFNGLTNGIDNCGIGDISLIHLTGGQSNTACGNGSLNNITTGNSNIGIGNAAGTNYTTSESSNIVIGNQGITSESHTIRIGVSGSSLGQQNRFFCAGITGVTVSASAPTAVDTNGQLSSLGFGSSGQLLQSTGAASSPAYTTATYPSSSGGSGKILYDNGTNFVESIPTFPASASATSRKIIVSDGTNWVASTETYATPGTSGNVLTSNGTNWTSAAPATSGTVTSVSGTANQVAVATGTTTPVISLIGPYTPATYTAHGVLVGEGTSSIIALAAGSAGQVLRSGGASADPAYSTATYPATAGTSGNVLTSDGTNWNSTAPASQFTPNSVIHLFDDFFAVNPTASILSSALPWTVSANGWAQSGGGSATAGHPGILGHTGLTSGFRPLVLGDSGSTFNDFVLSSGALTINWVFNITVASNSTNRYTLLFGLSDTFVSASIANGCWFQYSDNLNSGNWTINTALASTPTNTNSSTAASTGWHNAQIAINAAGTSAVFSIDGVTLGTISTNLPTTNIVPLFNVIWTAGTVPTGSVQIDLFYLTQTLTTPR